MSEKQDKDSVADSVSEKEGIVVGFEYDPNRCTYLAKIYNPNLNNLISFTRR